MQNLKQKLLDQGLAGALILRESGAQIPLRFSRGEFSKPAKLNLGPAVIEVELRLEEIPNTSPELPNLRLTIVPAGQRTEAPVITPVEAPTVSVDLDEGRPAPTPPPTPGASDDETPKTDTKPEVKTDTETPKITDEVSSAPVPATTEKSSEEPKAPAPTSAAATAPTTTTTTTTPSSSSGGKRNR